MNKKRKKEMKLPAGLFTVLALLIVLAVFLILNGGKDDTPSPEGIKPDNVPGDVKDTESEIKEDPNGGNDTQEDQTDEENTGEEEQTPENGGESETVTPPLVIADVPAGFTAYLGLDVPATQEDEEKNPFSDPYAQKQIAHYFDTFDGIDGAASANLVVVYSGEKLTALWEILQSAWEDTDNDAYLIKEDDCIRIGAAGLDGSVANLLATEGVACIYRKNRTDATECLILSVKPVRRELYSEDE